MFTQILKLKTISFPFYNIAVVFEKPHKKPFRRILQVASAMVLLTPNPIVSVKFPILRCDAVEFSVESTLQGYPSDVTRP